MCHADTLWLPAVHSTCDAAERRVTCLPFVFKLVGEKIGKVSGEDTARETRLVQNVDASRHEAARSAAALPPYSVQNIQVQGVIWL